MSAGVLTEGTRHRVGLGSSALFRDLPVLEDGLARDGILKSFELRVEMLDASLKLLDPELPIDAWLRLCRLGAWRIVRCALRSHCLGPPRLCGTVAREEEEPRPDGRMRPAPRVSIICLKLRASARSRFGDLRARG